MLQVWPILASWSGAGVFTTDEPDAFAMLDFVAGHYQVAGVAKAVGDILGGNFDPAEIGQHGYRIGEDYKGEWTDLDDMVAIGSLLSEISARIAADGGFVCVIEYDIQKPDEYLPAIMIGDHASDQSLATDAIIASLIAFGGNEVLDLYKYFGSNNINLQDSIPALPAPGRRRFASSFAFDLGTGQWRYAVSTNGSTLASTDVGFSLAPFAPGKVNFCGVYEVNEAPSDVFIRRIELYPSIDPADAEAGVAVRSTLAAFDLPAVADPAFADVVFLADFDTNTDGVPLDLSATPHTITLIGDAVLDSAVAPPFGATSSLLLDGTGDYAEVAAHADWDFGGGAFHVEAYVYLTTTGTTRKIVTLNGKWELYVTSAESLGFGFTKAGGGTVGVSSANGIVPTSQWAHLLFTRLADGRLYLFLDGAQVAFDGWHVIETVASGDGQKLTIGAGAGGGQPVTGRIGPVRIGKATGVQDSPLGFQPRTTAFPTS